MSVRKNKTLILCFTSVLILTALDLLPSIFGRTYAQKTETITPQIFRTQDKMLAVARQPDIPVSVVAVRNLENDWLKDVEIEVENKSGKPIYFLSVDFMFPDIPRNEGRGYSWTLFFGNSALMQIQNRASSQDLAIESEQRQSLKVTDHLWKGLQYYLESLKGLSNKNARRVVIRIAEISFGDGTGFIGGAIFPPKEF
jgi:hypothetical protein